MNKIYSLSELDEILKSEHSSRCFYRGQVKEYNWPLWPSMYRGCSRSDIFQIKNIPSQYRRGEYFAFRSVYLYEDRAKSEEFMRQRELKKLMMSYVRNALGFCLSEALFQQAGWSSQGLDVSSDYKIALFFATHNFIDGKYYIDNNRENIHILYKWDIPMQEWSLECLNHHDYYSLPVVFPTNDIMELFEDCETIEEHLQSIAQYRKEIGWNPLDFNLDVIRTSRPYKIIKFPKVWKSESRIAMQKAALLFPDFIDIEVISPYITDTAMLNLMKGGGQMLEDLSRSKGCRHYLFKATASEINTFVRDIPNIYPSTDISHVMLKGWMQSFFKNEYGTPMLVVPGLDPMSQIDASLNFDKLRYIDYGELYNQ